MSKERKNEIVTVDYVESMVYIIRGQQVMLDQDLGGGKYAFSLSVN